MYTRRNLSSSSSSLSTAHRTHTSMSLLLLLTIPFDLVVVSTIWDRAHCCGENALSLLHVASLSL